MNYSQNKNNYLPPYSYGNTNKTTPTNMYYSYPTSSNKNIPNQQHSSYPPNLYASKQEPQQVSYPGVYGQQKILYPGLYSSKQASYPGYHHIYQQDSQQGVNPHYTNQYMYHPYMMNQFKNLVKNGESNGEEAKDIEK